MTLYTPQQQELWVRETPTKTKNVASMEAQHDELSG